MRRSLAVLVTTALIQAPAAAGWSWPVDGPVLRPFALGNDPYAAGQHRGVDIGAAPGTTVRAATAGSVSFVGTVPTGGRAATVRTAGGLSVTYLELGATRVERGAEVAEGDTIGTIGPAAHLHLGVRVTEDPHGYLDPLQFLPPRPAAAARADPVPERDAAVVQPERVAEAVARAEPPAAEAAVRPRPDPGAAVPAPSGPAAKPKPEPAAAVPAPSVPAAKPKPEPAAAVPAPSAPAAKPKREPAAAVPAPSGPAAKPKHEPAAAVPAPSGPAAKPKHEPAAAVPAPTAAAAAPSPAPVAAEPAPAPVTAEPSPQATAADSVEPAPERGRVGADRAEPSPSPRELTARGGTRDAPASRPAVRRPSSVASPRSLETRSRRTGARIAAPRVRITRVTRKPVVTVAAAEGAATRSHPRPRLAPRKSDSEYGIARALLPALVLVGLVGGVVAMLRRRRRGNSALPHPAGRCALRRMRPPRLLHACVRAGDVGWPATATRPRSLIALHRPLPRPRKKVPAQPG